MPRFWIIMIPILIVGTIVIGLIWRFIAKTQKAKNVFPFIELGIGALIIIVVSILIAEQNKSGKICNETPGCMNETGMLYIFYYFVLFMGVLLTLSGVFKLIREYRKKDKPNTLS